MHLSLYALFIIAGIVTAAIWAERRWRARGGTPGAVWDVTTWAVLAGIVGGRLYHVLSSPDAYFTAAGSPVRALYVWQGGLSVWGAVIGGAVGAWLICRRRGYSFPLMADAAAPAVALAQAIGRWGCYFNQELYGRSSTLPWAVRIDPAHRPADSPGVATYQPTFLYESLWDLAVAGVVVWADRRWRLDRGRAFALYAALYTAGRGLIETLRIDPATHLLGLRINVWTSAVIFLAAITYLIVMSRRTAPAPQADQPDGTSAPVATPPVTAHPTEPADLTSAPDADTTAPIGPRPPSPRPGPGTHHPPAGTSPAGAATR